MHLGKGVPADQYDSGPYTVFKVTLRNGSTYALDFAGSQYGHLDAVTPWDAYAEKLVSKVHASREFGYTARKTKQDVEEAAFLASTLGMSTSGLNAPPDFDITREHLKNFEHFDAAVEDWCAISSISIAEMLRLPDAQYKEKSRSMLELAMEVIRVECPRNT